MKIVVALLVAMVVVAHAEQAKRQVLAVLAAAEPFLAKLAVDKLGIGKLVGKAVADIAGFIHGKTGTIPLEGTQIVLDYNIHRCHVKAGKKRIILGHLLEERCPADVCENKITKTCHSCTKGHQSDALKCAMEAEVAALQKLAQQAAAQQG